VEPLAKLFCPFYVGGEWSIHFRWQTFQLPVTTTLMGKVLIMKDHLSLGMLGNAWDSLCQLCC
jgi:hypothetical protein